MSTYSKKKDGNKFLSEHFAVREFACKNGADEILINGNLIIALENLFKKLDCKQIMVVSGYRTPAYSPTVGGYSTDQHTKGNAADIKCQKQDGTWYNQDDICCTLEDMDYQGGVGRIADTAHTNVHIDVRGKKCWFDERNGEKTTNSWYTYLGRSKPCAAQPATTNYVYKTVTAGYTWNIRQQPNMQGKIAGIAAKGAVMTLSGAQSGNFYQLANGNFDCAGCWISKNAFK